MPGSATSEKAGLEALSVQRLDEILEAHAHFLRIPVGEWKMHVSRAEIQRRLDAAQAEWDRRFPVSAGQEG